MSEKIVIIYLNNGNMESEVAKEIMFNRAVNEMIGDDNDADSTVLNRTSKSVVFTDGSKIELIPFTGGRGQIRGRRPTKVYLDESIMQLPNSTNYILNDIAPNCFGKYEDSILFYSVDNGELSITKYFYPKRG